MARIPDSLLDRLRRETNLVELLGGYGVVLTPKGGAHEACCPFHQEKTPSFKVSITADGEWLAYCFGCKRNFDALEIVTRLGGMAFPDAARHLARRLGIDVPEGASSGGQRQERPASPADKVPVPVPAPARPGAPSASPGGEEVDTALRDGILRLNAQALDIFQERLRHHAAALQWLEHRGIGSDLAARWRLGFAPDNRLDLADALRVHYPGDDAWQAAVRLGGVSGLFVRWWLGDGRRDARCRLALPPEKHANGRESVDTDTAAIHDRIVFPIIDADGRVAGFSARIWTPAQEAALLRDKKSGGKYVNSRASAAYQKREILYGLPLARFEPIPVSNPWEPEQPPAAPPGAEPRSALLVEGQVDAIACQALGAASAVAPCGSAFTPEQAALLAARTRRLVLLYDDDNGGRLGIRHALAVALDAGFVQLRVAALPPKYNDPGDLLRIPSRRDAAGVLSNTLGKAEDWRLWFARDLAKPSPHASKETAAGGAVTETKPGMTADLRDVAKVIAALPVHDEVAVAHALFPKDGARASAALRAAGRYRSARRSTSRSTNVVGAGLPSLAAPAGGCGGNGPLPSLAAAPAESTATADNPPDTPKVPDPEAAEGGMDETDAAGGRVSALSVPVGPPADSIAPAAAPAPPRSPQDDNTATRHLSPGAPVPLKADDPDTPEGDRPLLANASIQWADGAPDPKTGEPKRVRQSIGYRIDAIGQQFFSLWGERVGKVGGNLFVAKKRPDQIGEIAHWTGSPDALFAWMKKYADVLWEERGHDANGVQHVKRTEFFEHVRELAPAYTTITARPFHPVPEGAFMHWIPNDDRDPDGGALEDFLDFFNPATPVDRDLLRALVMTLFWGGPPGQRPMFVIAPSGEGGHEQDIGKTSLAQAVARIGGSYMLISRQPRASFGDSIQKQALEECNLSARSAIIDNSIGVLRDNDLTHIITTDYISGRASYAKHAKRANLIVWMVTTNDVAFSADLASRAVIIHLAPKPANADPAWASRLNDFIATAGRNVVDDCIAILRADAVAAITAKNNRFAQWNVEVLARATRNPDAALHHIHRTTDDANADITQIQEFLAALHDEYPGPVPPVPSGILRIDHKSVHEVWNKTFLDQREESTENVGKLLKSAVAKGMTQGLGKSTRGSKGKRYWPWNPEAFRAATGIPYPEEKMSKQMFSM